MADKVNRFLSGIMTKCYLKEPKKFGEKSSYSVYFDGVYEDTMEPYCGYLSSRYPVPVYEGAEDPIDPGETDDLKFKGRAMVVQSEWEGRVVSFLTAVSVEERLGIDDTKEPDGNPFLANPL